VESLELLQFCEARDEIEDSVLFTLRDYLVFFEDCARRL